MVRATEFAGLFGAGLAGAAYIPQISHLVREHCSAGLSRVAFGTWLVASLLVTAHAIAIGAIVFVMLGVIQLAASALILIYSTKYAHSYCAIHLPHVVQLERERGPRASRTNALDAARRARALGLRRNSG